MTSLCDCGRPVQDAHACGACAGQLEDALRQITGWRTATGHVHGLDVDLDVALMRLSRLGGTGGRTGAVPLLYDPRASTAAAALRTALVGWVRVAHESSGAHGASEALPADTLSAMAGWLLGRVERLRHLEAAGECVRDITGAVQHALRIVDRPPDRWYAGMCGAPIDGEVITWCQYDLYAPVGTAVIQCPGCRALWDVQPRRDWLLRQAEDVLAHAALIAQSLSALGTPVTKVMITRWVLDGRLLDHGTDATERKLYRLGDVIDLAHEHAQRQAVRTARKAEAV